MNRQELRREFGVINREAHMRSIDLEKGLDLVEIELVNEGKTTVEANHIVEQLTNEINPHIDGFLNTNDPQPFYDVINSTAIIGMSLTALAKLTTNLQDGIGGRPNDRNKPKKG